MRQQLLAQTPLACVQTVFKLPPPSFIADLHIHNDALIYPSFTSSREYIDIRRSMS